jgi:pimeloyl-ACP methyl ester carboxylesterase
MIERLPELVNGNAALVRRGRHFSDTLMIEVGERQYLVRIEQGRIADVSPVRIHLQSWSFAIRAAAEVWERFWQPVPEPGYHDLVALLRYGRMRFEGTMQPLIANLVYLKLVLETPRTLAGGGTAAQPAAAGAAKRASKDGAVTFEPIVGRYVHLEYQGRPHRIYFEEAGQGIPLLCLHTAGSDGRQYRALLNDAEVTKDFRVVVFDMPWHGKSSPPAGWEQEEYLLTTESYTELIMTVARALGLERPVVIGCSIGGRIVLQLALQHADDLRCVIGLQSSARVNPYYDISWLYRPDVQGGEVCAAMVSGLMAPRSPAPERWETLWHYMQGGPGVFKGDLHFYTIEGDIMERVSGIDTGKCPVYMLTGEYDYSASPADSRATAERIPGAQLQIMQDLGHFPMSESPAQFRTYLLPVLQDILKRERG